jgi:hypothetical protein
MGCLASAPTSACGAGGCFCTPEFLYPVFLCAVRTCNGADAQHAVPVLGAYGCDTSVRYSISWWRARAEKSPAGRECAQGRREDAGAAADDIEGGDEDEDGDEDGDGDGDAERAAHWHRDGDVRVRAPLALRVRARVVRGAVGHAQARVVRGAVCLAQARVLCEGDVHRRREHAQGNVDRTRVEHARAEHARVEHAHGVAQARPAVGARRQAGTRRTGCSQDHEDHGAHAACSPISYP